MVKMANTKEDMNLAGCLFAHIVAEPLEEGKFIIKGSSGFAAPTLKRENQPVKAYE